VEHRNIGRWREMREAFFRGDVGPALALYDENIVWTNDEAAGPIAGTHTGVQKVLEMLGRGMELYGGSLTQEVHATLASDEYVVEIMAEHAEVQGHRFENRAVYVYRLVNDKVVEIYTLDRDRGSAAEFWRAVSGGASTA
jgi:ketosteroid isomerase-like protein